MNDHIPEIRECLFGESSHVGFVDVGAVSVAEGRATSRLLKDVPCYTPVTISISKSATLIKNSPSTRVWGL